MNPRLLIISTAIVGAIIFVSTTDRVTDSTSSANKDATLVSSSRVKGASSELSTAADVERATHGGNSLSAEQIRSQTAKDWSEFSDTLDLADHKQSPTEDKNTEIAKNAPVFGSYLDDITLETDEQEAEQLIQAGLEQEFNQLGVDKLEQELEDDLASVDQL